VLIADGERAIIGSANLTDRGMDRNIELGVGITGPTVRYLRSAVLALMDPRINED
jgi:phosphatidylserine/phosphatidylglycerophosphate/cardiolipin synthase-like enzyme